MIFPSNSHGDIKKLVNTRCPDGFPNWLTSIKNHLSMLMVAIPLSCARSMLQAIDRNLIPSVDAGELSRSARRACGFKIKKPWNLKSAKQTPVFLTLCKHSAITPFIVLFDSTAVCMAHFTHLVTWVRVSGNEST